MDIKITTDYITLGQFLKYTNIIQSGGQEKLFLLSKIILVNNEKENRRGRKLYPGYSIKIEDKEYVIVKWL